MLKTVSSITNSIGALNYQGTWNASTNTPTLASGVGTKGDYYVVSVSGTTTLDGISTWGVGDWATYNGSVWQRVEGGADLEGVNLTATGTVNFAGATVSNGGSVTTVDINGGTVDGASIGASTASSGKFTTLDASSPVIFKNTGNVASATLQLFSGANTSLNSAYFPGNASVNGVNGTPSANGLMVIYQDSGNLRSISAAGSLNANGTDYAEYMTKSGDFTVAKGDVVGINNSGQVTQKFSEAVTFAVKSTNPCMVGGDAWFTEQQPEAPAALGEKATDQEIAENQAALAEYQLALAGWKTRMESARQTVDRIAFCGQVPVNLIGATPGDFIIPVETVEGGISAAAIKSPSIEQYLSCVGKVIAIEADGRARIIVKIS